MCVAVTPQWAEAREAARRPAMHSMVRRTQNAPASGISTVLLECLLCHSVQVSCHHTHLGLRGNTRHVATRDHPVQGWLITMQGDGARKNGSCDLTDAVWVS